MDRKRELFGGRGAAILAMAGSAIGLGNIWRFPYMVGQTGGAAFIILYLVCCLLLSLPIFLAEAVIGHRTHAGTFGALEQLAPGTKWKWLGLLTVLSPLVILSYYSVVGGWSMDYLWRSLTAGFHADAIGTVSSEFGGFIASPWAPLLCHTLFLGGCAWIVSAGVKSGIEKFNKVTMPLLFVLIVVIMGYSLTLPGSAAGVSYMLKPDFSKITPSAVAAAMGQSFFSLSLGVGPDRGLRHHAGGVRRRDRAGCRPGPHLRDAAVHFRQDGGVRTLAEQPRGGAVLRDHRIRGVHLGDIDVRGGCGLSG